MQKNDFIRFVTTRRHEPYGHRSGIFATAYEICRTHDLGEAERQELRALLDWFEASLAIPDRLAASKHPRAKNNAISWVRASAHEHTKRLRRLAALVAASGTVVDEIRTTRPGYVLYEDGHQVVALPFADTPR
jgi:hypothetical protein